MLEPEWRPPPRLPGAQVDLRGASKLLAGSGGFRAGLGGRTHKLPARREGGAWAAREGRGAQYSRLR